jgi:transcriptional regulator with XRE-family HTH domain
MVRNECFRVALDYLYKNGLVVDQKELSEKTKLSQTAISRILNHRVKEPSEASIRKLNDAFGNIFNPEYFRGHSIHLLMEDAAYYAKHPEKDPSCRNYVPIDERMEAAEPAEDYQAIPKWADSIIQLVTEQVKTIEDLRREVAALHQEINKLKS